LWFILSNFIIKINDLIKDVIKNHKHKIINYNLYYLLKYYNIFKEEIRILYNLNSELFIYNLQDVKYKVYEELNKDDMLKVILDNETDEDFEKIMIKYYKI
jgi:hypothetical protein